MSQLPLLPIEPTSTSLSSHLGAFDALIHQLESLPNQTRWNAQIPINGKARVAGSIVHTNDVKVCLGAGWWVEMTAREAVEYVQRKKMGTSQVHGLHQGL
jgi:CTD nuclear envelope phosphatase 1